MADVRTVLAEEMANVNWTDLMPHAKRDALIVVKEVLNLLDVGVAIAKNEVVSVQYWISEGMIHKPNSEELTEWNSDPSKEFTTLIVQPFVLIQNPANVAVSE